MNPESQIIISFLFKRSGKDQLKDTEIYLTLILELGWFSAIEAREFVKYALEQKLLIKKDGLLSPSFDVEKIIVPVGFYPTKKSFSLEKTVLKEEKINVMDIVVKQLVEKTGKESKEILKMIKKVETEKNIISNVALLLIAKNYNIDVCDYFDPVEKTIFKES